ncbi:hypothetical protein VQL36_09600 [Chengkuizengella sp. SCS-71B]|uniref:hypothetical protein n=1 Tax=Chengkuizengella sp. SCS-71B TaxID=3115290 RepID=UPI0032C23F4E
MNIKGTVNISIEDFDNLRKKAKELDELNKRLKSCSTVEKTFIKSGENEGKVTQLITIDTQKLTKIGVEHSLYNNEDWDDLYDEYEVKLINVEQAKK